ncbi:MAG: copper-binding protein [Burkholderiales bacterium]|nr:copper-binding protein [Burkholderiales bacterium]
MKAITLVAALAAFAAGGTAAQMHNHGHAAAEPATLSQAAAVPMADGEVRKIDKGAGKITLKHGPIKSIDMPPMTMVFQVRDRALLDKVKEGDKVRFAAEEKAGAYVVTAIEAAK